MSSVNALNSIFRFHTHLSTLHFSGHHCSYPSLINPFQHKFSRIPSFAPTRLYSIPCFFFFFIHSEQENSLFIEVYNISCGSATANANKPCRMHDAILFFFACQVRKVKLANPRRFETVCHAVTCSRYEKCTEMQWFGFLTNASLPLALQNNENVLLDCFMSCHWSTVRQFVYFWMK